MSKENRNLVPAENNGKPDTHLNSHAPFSSKRMNTTLNFEFK
jgi:hypothetical protein